MAWTVLRNAALQPFGISLPVAVPVHDRTGYERLFRSRYRTIIDIGAHAGEFAVLAHELVPDALIWSFEPLPGPYPRLQKVIDSCAEGSRVFQMALGDREQILEMIEYPFTPCSSFLRFRGIGRRMFPYMIGRGTRHAVPVRRLDDVLSDTQLNSPVLMKIDVQGYEDRVLRGAEKTLRQTDAVLMETSFIATYDDQVLFADLRKQMEALGFVYAGAISTHRALIGGKTVQEDSLFLKTKTS